VDTDFVVDDFVFAGFVFAAAGPGCAAWLGGGDPGFPIVAELMLSARGAAESATAAPLWREQPANTAKVVTDIATLNEELMRRSLSSD
jgi:hypothetical protein